jgi:hypothetical protein
MSDSPATLIKNGFAVFELDLLRLIISETFTKASASTLDAFIAISGSID